MDIQIILRALAQGLAGILVSKGWTDQSAAEMIGAGLLAAATAIWSHWHKKKLVNGAPAAQP